MCAAQKTQALVFASRMHQSSGDPPIPTPKGQEAGGRAAIGNPKVPDPAPDHQTHLVFTDKHKKQPPNSTVPKLVETTPNVVLTRALLSQGGERSPWHKAAASSLSGRQRQPKIFWAVKDTHPNVDTTMTRPPCTAYGGRFMSAPEPNPRGPLQGCACPRGGGGDLADPPTNPPTHPPTHSKSKNEIANREPKMRGPF